MKVGEVLVQTWYILKSIDVIWRFWLKSLHTQVKKLLEIVFIYFLKKLKHATEKLQLFEFQTESNMLHKL